MTWLHLGLSFFGVIFTLGTVLCVFDLWDYQRIRARTEYHPIHRRREQYRTQLLWIGLILAFLNHLVMWLYFYSVSYGR